jgi:hypothetical protein
MTKDRELLEAFKDYWTKKMIEGRMNFTSADIYSFLATRPEEKEESKWVSVKEKLPKRGTHVLAYKINSIIIVMYYNTDGKFIDRNVDQTNQVTHWMPLPEFNPNNQ